MVDAAYEKLPGALNARSMVLPSVKCEEFYNLISFLFTPEEASIFVSMPLGLAPIGEIAENLHVTDLERLSDRLETMGDKGLIHIRERGGKSVYEALPFVPGILDYQLMRGIVDEHHKKMATLMRDYGRAMVRTLTSANPPPMESYAPGKKVAVDKEINHLNTIVPFHEIKELLMKTEYISCGPAYADTREHCLASPQPNR